MRRLMTVLALAGFLLACTTGCGDDKPAPKAKDDGKTLTPNPKQPGTMAPGKVE